MQIIIYSQFSENILIPYPRNSFPFITCEGSIAFNQIFDKASTKFISITHIKCPKSIFLIHAKLSFVVMPSIGIIQVKILIIGSLMMIGDSLIIEDSKPMKRIINPTPRIADPAIRIVQHTISTKIANRIKLSFIDSTTSKMMFTISFRSIKISLLSYFIFLIYLIIL